MHNINLSGLSLKTGSGPLQRDVGSTAGDGFKQLFNNLIQQADQGPAGPDLEGDLELDPGEDLVDGLEIEGDELDELADEFAGDEVDDLLQVVALAERPG